MSLIQFPTLRQCHIRAKAMALVPILLLSACVTTTPEAPSPSAGPQHGNSQDTQASSELAPPPDTPEQSIGYKDILNLTPLQVQNWIGVPDLVRRDNAVQIMLYKTADCRINIIFYEDAPGQPFMARETVAHTLDGAAMHPDNCLSHIRATGFAPTASMREDTQ